MGQRAADDWLNLIVSRDLGIRDAEALGQLSVEGLPSERAAAVALSMIARKEA